MVVLANLETPRNDEKRACGARCWAMRFATFTSLGEHCLFYLGGGGGVKNCLPKSKLRYCLPKSKITLITTLKKHLT